MILSSNRATALIQSMQLRKRAKLIFGCMNSFILFWYNSWRTPKEWKIYTTLWFHVLHRTISYSASFQAKTFRCATMFKVWKIDLCFRTFYTEAKRNFGRHSDLSVDSKDPEWHLKPWSEMRSTLSEILHQLSIKSLFKKVGMWRKPKCRVLKYLICQLRLYVKPFYSPKLFEIHGVANAKNKEQLPAQSHYKYCYVKHKLSGCCCSIFKTRCKDLALSRNKYQPSVHIETIYTRWRRILRYERDKKLSIGRFQYTFFLWVRVC